MRTTLVLCVIFSAALLASSPAQALTLPYGGDGAFHQAQYADEGARVLAGGLGRPQGFDKGWYVKPTIFADVSNSMRIAQEEIFGPVLVMIPFEDEAEAIEMANDTPYGLASYLQSSDPERVERVAAQLRAGSVRINGGAFNYGSPFGGYKQSGNGREGGAEGLHDYLEMKTLHF